MLGTDAADGSQLTAYSLRLSDSVSRKPIANDLGQVYEQFLGLSACGHAQAGKVIRLTAGHQAKVEEKPEVRKAGLTAVGVKAILILQI